MYTTAVRAYLSLLSNWVNDEDKTPGTSVSVSAASICIRTPLQQANSRCRGGRLLLLPAVATLCPGSLQLCCCCRCSCWCVQLDCPNIAWGWTNADALNPSNGFIRYMRKRHRGIRPRPQGVLRHIWIAENRSGLVSRVANRQRCRLCKTGVVFFHRVTEASPLNISCPTLTGARRVPNIAIHG